MAPVDVAQAQARVTISTGGKRNRVLVLHTILTTDSAFLFSSFLGLMLYESIV